MRFFTQWDRENRLIVYGDIHGCLDEFIKLREKISPSALDVEVCVGDVTNKGPYSKETLRYLNRYNILCVCGNNEEKILRYLDSSEDRRDEISLSSKQKELISNLDNKLIDYLRRMPYFLRFENIVIVHGGLYRGLDLAKATLEELKSLMYIRYLDRDGSIAKDNRINKESRFFGDIYDGWDGFVVYGHQVFPKPKRGRFSLGLDTGCVYGKNLSAAVFEKQDRIYDTKRYKLYSIKSRKKYV